MSIFRSREGLERWKRFATGETGTAIDLVMRVTGCSCGSAFEQLAARAAIGPAGCGTSWPTPAPSSRTPLSAPGPTRVRARTEAYVTTCERLLWGPHGRQALEWLVAERALAPDVLHANRVGFDPGPGALARPSGLPRLGPAVVLPVLNDQRKAIFFQARYLDPDATGRKYDNPAAWVAPNPKLAWLQLPSGSPPSRPQLVVTEGIPDALAVVSAGVAAVAVLGASNATSEVAACLAGDHRMLVIGFDADQAGQNASRRLLEELAKAGRTGGTSIVLPPQPFRDLNDWLRAPMARGSPRAGLGI